MKRVLSFSFCLFFLSQFLFGEDIENLLNELQRKDDLSFYTKKETAGFLKIFTREDLDRMKIQTLGEIIDKIPFLRNKSDNFGLTDPYYLPYQVNNPSRIRLFINDREILTPLMGSGLKILGQIDINYIDHIEVYHGIPSYEISIEPSVVVIKAYTKVGKRENTTTVGASVGSNTSLDTYFYKSEKLDDFSYFAYVNHRNLNREKVYHNGSELSRDKTTNHLYSQIANETSNFELQILSGYMDNFVGRSWDMTPTDSDTDFDYFSSGYTYESLDKSLKAIVNYVYVKNTKKDASNTPLGLRKISTWPFMIPYRAYEAKMTEHVLDTKVTKKYKLDDTSILFGLSNRYKKFDITSYKLDDIEYSDMFVYDSEDIASVFSEINHKANLNNQFILSLNAQRYFENGGIDDDNIYGGRLGHIYSKDNFVQKSFLLYGKFHPSPLMLLENEENSDGKNRLKSETVYGFSTKSLWHFKDVEYSLLLARNIYEDGIYIDLNGYHNLEQKYTFDVASFETTYFLNSNDKIDFNAWVSFIDYGSNSTNRYDEEYGGYISLYKKIYNIDTYNSLSYVNGKSDNPDGWNYNLTLSYMYSKRLTLFFKGVNLFDKALTSDFISVNPISGEVTRLDDIANVDRSVWFGLEYQF